MTYKDAVSYLNSFYDYEKNPSTKKIHFFNLDRIKTMANLFGNPQNSYPTLHITGTKGKGSVASIVSCILKEAGFNVGLYISPHLVSLRERLKVDNKDIERREFASLVNELKTNLKKLGSNFKPSFFEIYTLLAFNYFKKKKIDFGIFEVGMGGRLDATNIIEPIACGITSISYDHTKELGKDLIDITHEKIGIIKKGIQCVSAPQKKEILKIIKDRCKQLNSRLFVVGKDITYQSILHSKKSEVFKINGLLGVYKNLKLSLLGEHQLINCAVSVGIVEALIWRGYKISNTAIYKGIANTKWPGRCEIVRRNPIIILDSAHNRSSANALKKTIKEIFHMVNLFCF